MGYLRILPQSPTITDTTSSGWLVGDTVVATSGSWRAGPATFGYQWQRCNVNGGSCSNIGGATAPSYNLTFADAGATVRVVVTASTRNGSRSEASAVSPVVTAILTQLAASDAATVTDVVAARLTNRIAAADAATVSDSSVVSIAGVTNLGAAQAITLTLADGVTVSKILTFPANAAPPALPTTSPFLLFPASPPAPVTSVPVIRLIIHNDSHNGTPIKATLLNSDNTYFNVNGGHIPPIEPGNRTLPGGTSWGTINVSVPGPPTAGMKLALQNIVTGDAAGFSVSVLAWNC